MLTDTKDCIDANYRMRHERAESQADRFEQVATETAVRAFDALRSLYIAQKKQHELAAAYEGIFEGLTWPDMDAGSVSKNARRIISMYAESLKWFEAEKLERVA